MHSNGTPTRYPRAVGRQSEKGQLGWSFFDWYDDYQKPAPLRLNPYSEYFWNAGVNMAYGREAAYQPVHTVRRSGGDTGLKPRGYRQAARWSLWGEPHVDIGVDQYARSINELAYGNIGNAKAELGDLFNDIMGAVVPGWDQRPQALKDLRVKADPAKIMEAAHKVAPNAGEKIVRAANANGLNVFVRTPAGEMEVTPSNAQQFYGLYPFVSRAGSAIGAVPPFVWLAVGGVGLVLLLMLKR